MDEMLKSLGTSDSSDSDKPSTSTTEVRPQPVRPAPHAPETNGQPQVSTVRLATGDVGSPDAESSSDTESDDGEESTDSASTLSADDNHTTADADFTSHSPTVSSSPPVTSTWTVWALVIWHLQPDDAAVNLSDELVISCSCHVKLLLVL